MSFYVFDFDGVLFDTRHECLEVAYQAVRVLPVAWNARWRDAEQPPLRVADAFARYRYRVGPPWQYALLLELIAERRLPDRAEDFFAQAAERRSELEPFTEVYFAQRDKLAANPRWLDLAKPYAQATRAFRDLSGRAAILSTRDDRSITRLCQHYLGIEPRLLPRSGASEKWQLLLGAAEQLGMRPESLFFVDDYVQHALPARRRGISAQLAVWGYLGPDDKIHALTEGLPCLQLSDLDRAIRAHEENHP